ncbi:MAG: cysteine hydrolase family protein [Pseudomonadota bacterium]
MTNTALILVDIQNDYFPSFDDSKMALPDMDNASAKAAKLLAAARDSGIRIVHIKHVMPSDAAPFFHPGTSGAELHDSVAPQAGETVIEKTRPNSFVDTNLESLLRDEKIEHLIICGAMSQMCIDATVRSGVDRGFKATVAQDACAAANVAYDGVNVPHDMVHASIMAPLASSYADVQPTANIISTMQS